ncbi:hypothetical protein MOD06_06805 [Bacillus atrophaeus]|nr:hypothetical protein [Bacillus atrophaeus]MCY8950212.1 hypothetical protein [Bacillus atrophaeus]MCY8969045.1 hypothetical protein [Bacillus atrophaeus]
MQYDMVPLADSVTAAISGSFVSLYIVGRRILTFYRLLYRFAYDGSFYRLCAFYRYTFHFPGNYCV